MDWSIQRSQWDLNAAHLGHTEVAVPRLAGEPGRQPASKARVKVMSIRGKKKRQREMDGDLGYLAGPKLGMVFSEQALRSVGRSVVDKRVLQ